MRRTFAFDAYDWLGLILLIYSTTHIQSLQHHDTACHLIEVRKTIDGFRELCRTKTQLRSFLQSVQCRNLYLKQHQKLVSSSPPDNDGVMWIDPCILLLTVASTSPCTNSVCVYGNHARSKYTVRILMCIFISTEPN